LYKTILSDDNKLFCYLNQEYIYIFHIPSNKTINTIKIKEKVSSICFDESSRYLIIGTENGNIYQYLYDKKLIYSKLYKFHNSGVSSLATNNNFLACSSNNGKLIIVNLTSHIIKELITNSTYKIISLYFADENHIVSIHIDGSIFINSLDDSSTTKKINLGIYGIKQILPMKNRTYALIVSSTNYLSLIDLKNSKVIKTKYITCKSKISRISIIYNSTLIIHLENNKIEIFKIATIHELKKNILHNKLYETLKLLESFPMLSDSKESTLVNDLYKEQYTLALNTLIDGKRKLALKYLYLFKKLKSKKDEIELLFLSFKNYTRFKELFSENKYAVCYAMSLKYKPLQETIEYKNIQVHYNECCLKAQKYMLKGEKDLAYKILNPFITIRDKKDFLKSILYNNEDFISFLKYIKNSEHIKIESLVQKHINFKNISTYTMYISNLEETMILLNKLLKIGDLESFNKNILKVKGVKFLDIRISELKLKSRIIYEFQESYKNNDFKHCYQLIDIFEYLKSLEIAKLLESHWKKLIKNCELFAFDGDINGIKNQLGELLYLKTRDKIITTLIKIAMCTKIDSLISQRKYKESENLIYIYIDMFAYTSEIKEIIKDFEISSKIKIAFTQDISLMISSDVSAKGF